MAFISIIMPVYNNEKYLPNAVNSIIDQTFPDWELIIIDDGSTDKTPQIADDLALSDNRIRVIHQDNQWIYKSYNNGYQAATGKYVFIVNSDDTINLEAVQKIHEVAEIDDADMIMFNMCLYIHCNDHNIVTNRIKNNIEKDFSYRDISNIHEKWTEFQSMGLIGHQCVYKTEIAKKILYRTDYYGGDIFYNIQIANELRTVAGTSYTVYNHFQYINNKLNASVGKYYGYEHSMFNDYYFESQKLYQKWNKWTTNAQNSLTSIRFTGLTCELLAYKSDTCPLKIDEKLKKIVQELSDNVVYKCAKETNRLEEYESRILSGLRELFLKEIPSEDCEYYFFYQMLDKLLAYEKTEEDMEIIRQAVYHPLNPHNIGQCFYKKLL